MTLLRVQRTRVYDSRLKELTEFYKGKNANVEQELVADLVGDYLFTDADFIKHLSTEHRNLAQKIYDEIKYLCKIVTAGTKEARQLEKVKKAFADAYRAETKNPTKDGGVKFSFGVTQADIDTYVDNAYANQNSQDYRKYAEVSEKLCNDVQADINLNGYPKSASTIPGFSPNTLLMLLSSPTVMQFGLRMRLLIVVWETFAF